MKIVNHPRRGFDQKCPDVIKLCSCKGCFLSKMYLIIFYQHVTTVIITFLYIPYNLYLSPNTLIVIQSYVFTLIMEES